MNPTSLGYQTDLALLRLGGSEITDRGDHLVVRTPQNPGYWWGNFLLLDHVPAEADAPAWLERFAAEFPDARHLALGFDGTAGTTDDLGWFSGRGYYAEAQAVMTASAVHPPRRVNDGATYRRLVSDDDWARGVELRVRCNARQEAATYRRFAAAKMAMYRELTEAGHGAWWGAFVGADIVSQMGLFRAGPGLARFQSVETDPAYRRQGLAGSLIPHVAAYGFGELAARTLVMVADPTYVAIDLYRAVGFAVSEAQLQVEHAPS